MKKTIIDLITYFEPRAWWIDKLADQINDAFKARIAECKKPETDISVSTEYGLGYYHGWDAGIDEDRKALMESLDNENTEEKAR